MEKAGADLRKDGAKRAKTSVVMLVHVFKGRRKPTPELAGRIAKGLNEAAEGTTRVDLPVLRRGDVSDVCKKCPYYKRCDLNLD